MKCIRCGHDSTYKDRQSRGTPNRTCPSCHHQFAFEPRQGDPFTDAAFKHAIESVSAKGQVRWGVEHLYYELCRRQGSRFWNRPGRRLGSCGCLASAAIILAMSLALIWEGEDEGSRQVGLVLSAILILGLIAALIAAFRRTPLLDREKFSALYERWVQVHGQPEAVIVRPAKPPPPRALEPDVFDYSFDRAVICDRARTVDLLLANNFHFENNCAVLSYEGYPPGPFPTVVAMLKRNPRLEVFALHDATQVGCQLAHRLAHEKDWFNGQVTVTDVGLRPGHAKPFKRLLLFAESPVSPGLGIDGDEAQWLSRYKLELAAIRPEQILKRLYRAINKKYERSRTPAQVQDDKRQPKKDQERSDSGGGDLMVVSDSHKEERRLGEETPANLEKDMESFSTNAGDSDHGGDGFG